MRNIHRQNSSAPELNMPILHNKATIFKPSQLIRYGCGLSIALLMTACSSLLPRSHNESSPFQSFEGARMAIDGLIPMQSNVTTLTKMGIDPLQHPNITILTHDDVVRRFIPSTLLKRADLDPGVLACMDARDACRGWGMTVNKIDMARTGNFLSDFTNFHRRTETTGWRFNALILLVDDIVVYRTWGGQPRINEIQVNTNPLGPLQGMGPSIVTEIVN